MGSVTITTWAPKRAPKVDTPRIYAGDVRKLIRRKGWEGALETAAVAGKAALREGDLFLLEACREVGREIARQWDARAAIGSALFGWFP